MKRQANLNLVKNAYIKLEQSQASELQSARSPKQGGSEREEGLLTHQRPGKVKGLAVDAGDGDGAADPVPAPMTVKYTPTKSFFGAKQRKCITRVVTNCACL